VVYYCEASEDHALRFHSGGKDGPTIATAETCLDHEGDTEMHFIPHHNSINHYNHEHNGATPSATHSPKTSSPLASTTPSTSSSAATTVTLTHVHHHFPSSLHGKTSFTFNNKKYHWLAHTQLVEEATGDLVARFEPTWFEGKGHKIGRLEVMECGMGLLQVVVFSALVVQERTDDHKQAV